MYHGWSTDTQPQHIYTSYFSNIAHPRNCTLVMALPFLPPYLQYISDFIFFSQWSWFTFLKSYLSRLSLLHRLCWDHPFMNKAQPERSPKMLWHTADFLRRTWTDYIAPLLPASMASLPPGVAFADPRCQDARRGMPGAPRKSELIPIQFCLCTYYFFHGTRVQPEADHQPRRGRQKEGVRRPFVYKGGTGGNQERRRLKGFWNIQSTN